MKLADKLIYLRKEKRLTQAKLAEMMDVSRQAVSRWEVGDAVPSTENLKYLGRLYDVPLEYLLHDDAPELICTDLELDKEKSSSANEAKKRSRNIVLVLIAVGIIVVVALSVMLFGNKREEAIPMEDIKGSDMVTVDDFEMVW